MTCVLALDVSMTRTGWALGGPQWDRFTHGVFETANWEKRQGYNLVNFRKFLDARASTFNLTHLAVERIFVNANPGKFQWNGTEAQLMLAGVAVEWASGRGITPMWADIKLWRHRFLGHSAKPNDAGPDSKYWKDLALRRAAELNYYCTHHDEAEALGILDFALAALDVEYRRKTNPRHRRVQNDMDLKRGLFG